jgi:hypothetical protein
LPIIRFSLLLRVTRFTIFIIHLEPLIGVIIIIARAIKRVFDLKILVTKKLLISIRVIQRLAITVLPTIRWLTELTVHSYHLLMKLTKNSYPFFPNLKYFRITLSPI